MTLHLQEPLNLCLSHGSPGKKENRQSGSTYQRQLTDLLREELSHKEALRLQEVLYYEHTQLVSQLSERSEVEGQAGAYHRLHHIYMLEVERIEKDRYSDLLKHSTASDSQKQLLFTTYDQVCEILFL